MKLAALALALAGCATDSTPAAVADNLALPADLQVVGDQVYSLQYDGSIITFSTKDHAVHTLVPPVREVAANEIPVDLDTYNLVVTSDALTWTSNATGTATVMRAALDGSNPTMLDQALTPFRALVATDAGACWTGALSITCEHGTIAFGVDHPQAMLANGNTLYFATSSALSSVPLTGGPVQTIATKLGDVRAMAIAEDQLIWADAGTETCEQLCTPNLDASLHTFSLTEPDGGSRVITSGYASIEDGLAIVGNRVYFDSEARLRSRSLKGVEAPGQEALVSHATLACRALGVAGDELYCANDNAIEAIAMP